MKKVYPLHTRCFGPFSKIAVFGFVLMSLFAVSASAQSSLATAPAPISTVDLEDPNWKIPSEYGSIVAAERVVAAQKLGTQGIPASETAVLTGYDRLLEYMQADLATWQPIGSIAANSQKRVLSEAPTDPILQAMDVASFEVFYSALVARLVRQ